MSNVIWKHKKRIANLVKQVKKIDNQYTEYGFFKSQGNHPESPHLSFAQLMGIHELRPASDPEYRPVFKISLERGGDTFKANNIRDVKKYIDNSGLNKKPSPRTLLENIAINGLAITEPTFGDASLLKSNTTEVARQKGRNTPMVDFGILKDALAHSNSLRKSVKRYK